MSSFKPRFFDPNADILKSGGGLPHWEQKGVCYFVTFRLADSLPMARLREWKEERARWMIDRPRPWDDEVEKEYHRRFAMKIERWLDQGMGECLLRRKEVRDLVLERMLDDQGERLFVHRMVLMPNHVHGLFSLLRGPLAELMRDWKGASGYRVNRLLGRRGKLWQRDYFDRIVRDGRHFERCVRYIDGNPGKAGLGEGDYTLWVAD